MGAGTWVDPLLLSCLEILTQKTVTCLRLECQAHTGTHTSLLSLGSAVQLLLGNPFTQRSLVSRYRRRPVTPPAGFQLETPRIQSLPSAAAPRTAPPPHAESPWRCGSTFGDWKELWTSVT